MNKLDYKYKKLAPFKLFVLENFPFIEADFDAITNYQLMCKIVEYINEVAKNNDIMIDNVEALNNWFNNLDVQTEINNKLDAMAQDGTLEELIVQYVNLSSVLAYNNVNDMKNATNLVNGSFVKTYGFYNINDGGGAFYKIRNVTTSDVIDNASLIAINENLVAELIINNSLNILQIGVNPKEDITSYLQLLNNIIPKYKIKEINFPSFEYILNGYVTYNNLSDCVFNFAGKITAKSSASHFTKSLLFTECNNITINNYNITSTLDQYEQAPTGTTKHSYDGSNRIGIATYKSSNLYFNNCNFENMDSDFLIEGETNYESKNVYINNWISKNASMPIYSNNTYNVYINNAIINTKNELGTGCHVFYFSDNTKNLHFENIEMESDGYLGEAFHFYNSNDTEIKDIYINNIKAKVPSFIIVQRSNHVEISNVDYEFVNSLTTIEVIINIYVVNYLKISDSNFSKLNDKQLFRFYASNNAYIDNCNIDLLNKDINLDNFLIENYDNHNNIIFNSCNIECGSFIKNTTGINSNYEFKNCDIKANTNNYFLMNLINNTLFAFKECDIKLKNNVYFNYSNGTSGLSNNVNILNCFLSGYNNLEDTTGACRVINSYKDFTLIQ